MKKRSITAVLLLFALLVLSAAGYVATRGDKQMAQAELSVGNMTCGSCVSNIEKALAGLDGVGQVDVSVTLGSAKVMFAAASLTPQQIAGVISAGGYPASVRRVLSAEEVASLHDEQQRLEGRFVGRIGEYLVSKEEFSGSSRLGDAESKAAWQSLVQRQLLLQDAERNGVVVHDDEVRLEIDALRGKHDGFDAYVEKRYGNPEAFFASMKENMIINRNIEQNVLQARQGPRQQQLDRWYQGLAAATEVVIFAPALKAATSTSSSGCGGSCCG